MTITKEQKQELIGQYRRGTADTGSPEVQVALLTNRINGLTDHLRQHKKDYACRRGLLMLVGQRRRLLDYLKKVNVQRYLDVIRRLELRK
jgi:small subunit ribosomal protein S15